MNLYVSKLQSPHKWDAHDYDYMIYAMLCWYRAVSLHVHRDLPAVSGYGEAEQQQCGKVTWGFLHWAPEERKQDKSN